MTEMEVRMMTADQAPTAVGRRHQLRTQHATSLYLDLLGTVRRRWPGEDAEDVVQDAFVRLAIAQTRCEVRNPAALLHVVAHNLIRDRHRAAAARGTVLRQINDVDHIAIDGPLPDCAVAARQRLAIVSAVIAELPPDVQAAVIRHRFDEIPQAWIASELGVSVSMVEKHIRGALKHCRRRLAEIEEES
ncbi:MAG: RNA polymerase sigma factor [Lysobacteraceae bacterium]|nr:MAG: RNA polymerase sigma factor [Xanthomonadaceae bacterium]